MYRFFTIFICIFFLHVEAKNCKPIVTKPLALKPYKILTLDGGGIRGVYTLQLIAMLEEETHFLQHVDFFAGTSTGSIIALALAYNKMSVNEIIDRYKQYASMIFSSYTYVDPFSICPKYNNEQLRSFLQKFIPNHLTLADIEKKVLCVAFQLYNETSGSWQPLLLDNMNQNIAKNIEVVDALLRGTAAPTYFPSYQKCIDGGVIANNPSMVALARALDKYGANQKLSNIRLLSLGTGVSPNYIDEEVAWGITQWVVYCPRSQASVPKHPLLEIIMDATVSVPHYECEQILGSNYYRLNGFFSTPVALDDVQQINFLIEEAKRLPESDPDQWQKLCQWVRKNFCQ